MHACVEKHVECQRFLNCITEFNLTKDMFVEQHPASVRLLTYIVHGIIIAL